MFFCQFFEIRCLFIKAGCRFCNLNRQTDVAFVNTNLLLCLRVNNPWVYHANWRWGTREPQAGKIPKRAEATEMCQICVAAHNLNIWKREHMMLPCATVCFSLENIDIVQCQGQSEAVIYDDVNRFVVQMAADGNMLQTYRIVFDDHLVEQRTHGVKTANIQS